MSINVNNVVNCSTRQFKPSLNIPFSTFPTFLFIVIACFLSTVDAYVCVLKQRLDPSTGRHRWSMPLKERCHCQAVVAPQSKSAFNGPTLMGQYEEDQELWYTDNKGPLTVRKNWSQEMLDKLLERAEFCSKFYYIIKHNS
jgi:hypothetical protein